MKRFRGREGVIEMRLRPDEVRALSLLPRLLESVGHDPRDPAAERLSVEAYPDDEEAQAEYGRLMAPEMDQQRQADRAVLSSSLESAQDGPVDLTPAAADSWLLVVNEARLALAARLGIEEEGWGLSGEQRGMRVPEMALLVYLTDVQDELISVLADYC